MIFHLPWYHVTHRPRLVDGIYRISRDRCLKVGDSNGAYMHRFRTWVLKPIALNERHTGGIDGIHDSRVRTVRGFQVHLDKITRLSIFNRYAHWDGMLMGIIRPSIIGRWVWGKHYVLLRGEWQNFWLHPLLAIESDILAQILPRIIEDSPISLRLAPSFPNNIPVRECLRARKSKKHYDHRHSQQNFPLPHPTISFWEIHAPILYQRLWQA